MKPVLRAANYPNLDCLGLYSIDEESARGLFTEQIINQGDLPNLKRFSLSCNVTALYYNELVLLRLYQMSNLQERLYTSSPKVRSPKAQIAETRAETNITEKQDRRNQHHRNTDYRYEIRRNADR
ncbi:unnamed protein product [Rotaria socialis]|nr:unnamed protein product [Rotaria socialis]